jgi:hypothetical protein
MPADAIYQGLLETHRCLNFQLFILVFLSDSQGLHRVR